MPAPSAEAASSVISRHDRSSRMSEKMEAAGIEPAQRFNRLSRAKQVRLSANWSTRACFV
jgi:hypothetical protein